MLPVNNKAKEIAETTLKIIEDGEYTTVSGKCFSIVYDIKQAVDKSKLYLKDYSFLDTNFGHKNLNPTVSVVSDSILEISLRLREERPVALNFANPTTPGGGFKSGAIAQEETICRSSCLYPTLIMHPKYYEENEENKEFNDFYYNDNMIYSPDVLVFKNDEGDLLDDPWHCSFITSPAPMRICMENIGSSADEIEPKLKDVMTKRITNIIKVAAENQHRTIILGAWGCGAFGNDPFVVSQIFQNVLKEYPYFDNIVFSIFTNSNKETNLNFTCFRDLFAGTSG